MWKSKFQFAIGRNKDMIQNNGGVHFQWLRDVTAGRLNHQCCKTISYCLAQINDATVTLLYFNASCLAIVQISASFISTRIFARISSPILTSWMPASTPIYNMYIIWTQISISANEIQHSANWQNAPLSRWVRVWGARIFPCTKYYACRNMHIYIRLVYTVHDAHI